jgi:hypothetical protein
VANNFEPEVPVSSSVDCLLYWRTTERDAAKDKRTRGVRELLTAAVSFFTNQFDAFATLEDAASETNRR